MVAMLWLAWQSTRYAREPMSFPRVGGFIPRYAVHYPGKDAYCVVDW
jgi:hypothetical protein